MSSKPTEQAEEPRALVHKKILDEAAANPEASIPALADGVSGASSELVERVLERYGDPGSDEATDPTTDAAHADTETPVEAPIDEQPVEAPTDETIESDENAAGPTGDEDAKPSEMTSETTAEDGGDAPTAGSETELGEQGNGSSESDVVTESDAEAAEPVEERDDEIDGSAASSADDLTAKQLTVLRAVAERPDAPQSAIADAIGVTAPTVSRRASKIDGFEWSERASFVATRFDDVEQDAARDEERTAADDRDDGDGAGEAVTDDEPVDTADDGDDGESLDAPDGEGHESLDTPDDDRNVEERPADDDRNAAPDDVAALAERVTRLEELVDRLDRLEATVERSTTAERSTAADGSGHHLDPTLVHKVVHACVESEHISDEEELAVIQAVLGR